MPLLRINSGPDGLALHGMQRPLTPVLKRGLQTPGPIILMIHGYKYAPGHATACPHDKILGMKTRRDSRIARSWPRGLGFGSGVSREGLGIAFGWNARGTIWQAYAQAQTAGWALAELITQLRTLAPSKPIHVLAHSLGARVILSALPRLAEASIGRVILLSGAEFGGEAKVALDSLAGQSAEFINVTSRQNDLFDFMMEHLVRRSGKRKQTISHAMPNWQNVLTVQMDNQRTLDTLLRCGFRIADPVSRVSHWSSYMRPGVFNLYRALLRRSDMVDLAHLQRLLPIEAEPRWSRLFTPRRTPSAFLDRRAPR